MWNYLKKIIIAPLLITVFILQSPVLIVEAQQLGMTFPIVNPTLGLSGLGYNFDVVDEYLYKDTSSWGSLSETGGKAVAVWFDLENNGADPSAPTFIGVGGTTGATPAFYAIGTRTRSATYAGERLAITSRASNGGTVKGYYGSTSLSPDTVYLGIFQTDATSVTMYLCPASTGVVGTETVSMWTGTNTGDWFGEITVTGTRKSTIGASYAGGNTNGFFDGTIDNIMIFNDDLTSTERTALCNKGKPIHPEYVGLTSKLGAFYKLGEDDAGSATTSYDASGIDDLTSVNMENADIVPTNYY